MSLKKSSDFVKHTDLLDNFCGPHLQTLAATQGERHYLPPAGGSTEMKSGRRESMPQRWWLQQKIPELIRRSARIFLRRVHQVDQFTCGDVVQHEVFAVVIL